jgi:hypothetical protein
MLIHRVAFCLVDLFLLLLFILGDLLKAGVFYLLDHSENGNDEVKDEQKEDDDLKQEGVDVVRARHTETAGKVGGVR